MDDELTTQEADDLMKFVRAAVNAMHPLMDELFSEIDDGEFTEMAQIGVFNGVLGQCMHRIKMQGYDFDDAMEMTFGVAFDVYHTKRDVH